MKCSAEPELAGGYNSPLNASSNTDAINADNSRSVSAWIARNADTCACNPSRYVVDPKGLLG